MIQAPRYWAPARALGSAARRTAIATVALLVLAGGCARALSPVDPGSALGSADPAAADPAEARRLMDRAEAAYASRPDEAAVEEAVNLWLEAAVVDATDADPIMGAVRAQTWLAEYASDPARRRSVAAESVDTAQWCRRRERANSACSYYLALAVGVQANQVRSTATDGLEIIVRALNNTIADAETIDHAGPHRVLALVLVRAPGWPIGPGDPDLALVHAERAVELFPAYGPNWLALAEARQETDQATAALAAYQCALEAARATSRDPDAAIWIAEAQAALAGTAGAACTER